MVDLLGSAFFSPRSQLDLGNCAIGECIGRGGNNEVLEMGEYVIRRPLRGADTRLQCEAYQEAATTVLAAQLGVAPQVHDTWYAPRRCGRYYPRGLYMITDRYPHNLHTLIDRCPYTAIRLAASLRAQLLRHIRTLAQEGIFCVDIKPANVVCRTFSFGIDTRIIDFGTDYTEYWASHESRPDKEQQKCMACMYAAACREKGASELDARCAVHAATTFIMCALLHRHIDDIVEDHGKALYRTEACALRLLETTTIALGRALSAQARRATRVALAHKLLQGVTRHYFSTDSTRALRKVLPKSFVRTR